MQWSSINFRPDTRTLRQFAGLWILFLGGIAAWQGWMHERTTVAITLAILAVVVGVSGLLVPQLIRPVFVGCMVLTFPIGWVMARILLAVLYYVIFTPLGQLFRLCGRDVLYLRPQTERETFWMAKPVVTDMRRYFRQF
jgi:hypothetical protein